MKDQATDTGITKLLATFAATQDAGDICRDAAAVMRLSILDWLVVGLAGRDEPVARAVRALAQDEGGAPQAHALGIAHRVPARMAALVNGSASHALDYDDTHFAHIGHPSVAVVSAALAMAERVGASGAAFQTAALIGCESSVRVGLWLGRAHYQAGFHQTATAGAFGAGLAAGRLLGLNSDRMADVLGLLTTRASGLKSQFGSMGKPFNAGIAAANGVEAALLVANGFEPRRDALDVAQGFGPTHHGAAELSALDTLGTGWLFTEVSHKFHACCHGLHAALEALAGTGTAAEDIAQIRVATHPRWLSVCNIAAPRNGLQAKFSYAQVLALQLLGHDTARLETYSDALCADPGVVALRNRVEVIGDESVAETASHLTLVLRDGTNHEVRHDLTAPMTLDARRAKVLAKAESLLGVDHVARLVALVDGQAAPSQIGSQLV